MTFLTHIEYNTLNINITALRCMTISSIVLFCYYHRISVHVCVCVYITQQLFSYSNIGTVNTVTGVISPTNLSLLSNPGGSPSSSSGGGNGGGGGRSRGHSQTTLPRWNTQCSSGPPFITLDEDYMMTPLMSGNGGQVNGATLIDDGKYIYVPILLIVATKRTSEDITLVYKGAGH